LKTLPLPSPAAAHEDHGKESRKRVRLEKGRKAEASERHGSDRNRGDQARPNLSANQPPMGRMTVAIAAAQGA
jgi:hypothetical protein